jgi:hypothetical protein
VRKVATFYVHEVTLLQMFKRLLAILWLILYRGQGSAGVGNILTSLLERVREGIAHPMTNSSEGRRYFFKWHFFLECRR